MERFCNSIRILKIEADFNRPINSSLQKPEYLNSSNILRVLELMNSDNDSNQFLEMLTQEDLYIIDMISNLTFEEKNLFKIYESKIKNHSLDLIEKF